MRGTGTHLFDLPRPHEGIGARPVTFASEPSGPVPLNLRTPSTFDFPLAFGRGVEIQTRAAQVLPFAAIFDEANLGEAEIICFLGIP